MELNGIRNAKQMREVVEEHRKMQMEREMSELLNKHNKDLSMINSIVYKKSTELETSVKVMWKDLTGIDSLEDLKELAMCLTYRGYHYGYLNENGDRARGDEPICGLNVIWSGF